ncbi:hypothetical protein I79_007298 [Cricetulus griseus]|uniref:Uncharacterized protein n=1 Tax=Cricetulus griseus TaxID=10029 RepID=G3HA56_CRIGR|nr:hypothetical protein I79_007298 [Cricetulus griseus]
MGLGCQAGFGKSPWGLGARIGVSKSRDGYSWRQAAATVVLLICGGSFGREMSCEVTVGTCLPGSCEEMMLKRNLRWG